MLDEELDDDATATTADLTALEGESDSESDDDAEDFAAENAPRPPPRELLYNGKGTWNELCDIVDGREVLHGRDVVQQQQPDLSGRPGRSRAGSDELGEPKQPGHRRRAWVLRPAKADQVLSVLRAWKG